MAWLVGESSHRLKKCGFNSKSGHILGCGSVPGRGLWGRWLIDGVSLSPLSFLPPSPSLSMASSKDKKKKKGCIQLLFNYHQKSQPRAFPHTLTNTGINKAFKAKRSSPLHYPHGHLHLRLPALSLSHAVHQVNCGPGWATQGKRTHSADPSSCVSNTAPAPAGGPSGFLDRNALDVQHRPWTVSQTRAANQISTRKTG